MSTSIKIIAAFSCLLIALLVLIKKGRIPVKYSLIWIFAAVVMILFGCFPYLASKISTLLGFQLPSNMILTVFLGLVILISISQTIILSQQTKRINFLVQEVSLLKAKIEKDK